MHKKEVEKKLKEAEKRLGETQDELKDLEFYTQDLLSFVPVGFCLLSGVGKVVNTNEAFEKLTGYELSELSGRFLKDLFLEKEKFEQLLNEASEKDAVRNKIFTLVSKSQKEIPISLSVSTRREPAGELIGYFVGFLDITDMKKLQEDLEKKVKERTKELEERVNELERIRKLTEGRELRMAELKRKLARLEEKIRTLEKSRS